MIERASWSDRVEAVLKPAMRGADLFIRGDVRSGKAQLWRVDHQGASGYIVTRSEVAEHGREWVLVAGAGCGLRKAIPAFEHIARESGFHSMRTHVQRRGMIRLYQRLGWHIDEYILRRTVNER